MKYVWILYEQRYGDIVNAKVFSTKKKAEEYRDSMLASDKTSFYIEKGNFNSINEPITYLSVYGSFTKDRVSALNFQARYNDGNHLNIIEINKISSRFYGFNLLYKIENTSVRQAQELIEKKLNSIAESGDYTKKKEISVNV